MQQTEHNIVNAQTLDPTLKQRPPKADVDFSSQRLKYSIQVHTRSAFSCEVFDFLPISCSNLRLLQRSTRVLAY